MLSITDFSNYKELIVKYNHKYYKTKIYPSDFIDKTLFNYESF